MVTATRFKFKYLFPPGQVSALSRNNGSIIEAKGVAIPKPVVLTNQHQHRESWKK